MRAEVCQPVIYTRQGSADDREPVKCICIISREGDLYFLFGITGGSEAYQEIVPVAVILDGRRFVGEIFLQEGFFVIVSKDLK